MVFLLLGITNDKVFAEKQVKTDEREVPFSKYMIENRHTGNCIYVKIKFINRKDHGFKYVDFCPVLCETVHNLEMNMKQQQLGAQLFAGAHIGNIENFHFHMHN